jgi:predicted subunit of tRNA(5-methylaminomethyl-2-thiouridylate) methyltransferase
MVDNKILVLYSGGLDSRLAVKLLKEKGYEITCVFFSLPFASDKHINDDFLEKEGIKLEIFDCTKGPLLQEYLDVLKHPQYGRGKGINPCIDCKLFMFKHLERLAVVRGIKYIASGEVPGQRPMSQTKGASNIIDKNLSFKIIRPLEDIGIEGRSRKTQIQLAGQYEINYPSPAGGCLLCEKALRNRFDVLLKHNLINEKSLSLINLGRHYYFSAQNYWFIVGRNEAENSIIEKYDTIIPSGKGKPAVFYHGDTPKIQELKNYAIHFQEIYMNKDHKKIEKTKPWKI